MWQILLLLGVAYAATKLPKPNSTQSSIAIGESSFQNGQGLVTAKPPFWSGVFDSPANINNPGGNDFTVSVTGGNPQGTATSGSGSSSGGGGGAFSSGGGGGSSCFSANVEVKLPNEYMSFAKLYILYGTQKAFRVATRCGIRNAKLIFHSSAFKDVLDIGSDEFSTTDHGFLSNSGEYIPASKAFPELEPKRRFLELYNIHIETEIEAERHFIIKTSNGQEFTVHNNKIAPVE
jgi:hypothetical protein